MQKLLSSCGSVNEAILNLRKSPLKPLRFTYDSETYDKILKNLDLDVYGTDKVNLIDYNVRISPLSKLLNEKLRPKHHLLFPDGKIAYKFWSRIAETEEFTNLHVTDPPIANTIKANVLSKPLEKNWLEPRFLTRQETKTEDYGVGKMPVNESLLFIADFSSTANAGCLRTALYYNEVATCMFRYSGVRFLAWSRPTEVLKFLTDVGTMHRRTNSLMAGLYSDIRLIACSEKLSNEKAKRLINNYRKDNEVVTLKEPFSADEYCLLEFKSNHNKYFIQHPDELHLCIHKLFNSPGSELKTVLHTLGPGAEDYLSAQLPAEMLVKKISHLSNEDFIRISEKFWEWPFKPDINLDLFSSQDYFSTSED